MFRKFKKVVLGLLAHVTPSICFNKMLRSEALVYNRYFFQNGRSTEIIRHSTLDSHTNTVLSNAFAPLIKMASKPWQGLFSRTQCHHIDKCYLEFKNSSLTRCFIKRGKGGEGFTRESILCIKYFIVPLMKTCPPQEMILDPDFSGNPGFCD